LHEFLLILIPKAVILLNKRRDYEALLNGSLIAIYFTADTPCLLFQLFSDHHASHRIVRMAAVRIW
jgi:hypothetical protein